MHHTSALAHRLHALLAHAGANTTHLNTVLDTLHPDQPTRLREALADLAPGRILVTGTLEHRLALAEHPGRDCWTIAELSGTPLATRAWPSWAREGIAFDNPRDWISAAQISTSAERRLTRPRLVLAALYHPEHFPLPRFPLAISDLARAARATLTGQVTLLDMQLGTTIADIITAVHTGPADILGVSATFGQHDLLVTLLDAIAAIPDRPLVIAGGSLTARNEHILLQQFPWLLIARGAGEQTIAGLIAFWHSDIELDQIHGIGYTGAARGEGTLTLGRYRKTATVPNRARTDIFPELDLLAATFDRHGVAQLESSRGCTNYCSFCPRGHKGAWSGVPSDHLPMMLTAMSEVFDRYPDIARTLYLVDEEFLGRGPDAAPRALAVAGTLHEHRFAWETSCRIDQIVRRDTDRDWHLDRARLWRTLCRKGLRRCLFGVESGVTSILTRFNKETTAEQNALAIRTLSALGVPTRYTYITFDHLMNLDELRATRDFQARTDLLLHPLPELPLEQIIDGVHDDAFAAEHATGQPFYQAISYMLVSMECLIGAAYTRQAHAVGLTGATRPSMGRVDASFLDPRIGVLSHHAQLWVDRTFALDYTLKSLEKILDGPPQTAVRDTRTVIKDAAFGLLDDMLTALDSQTDTGIDRVTGIVLDLMDRQFDQLRATMTGIVEQLGPVLPQTDQALLDREFTRWNSRTGWQLINVADPCGT